MQCVPVIGVLYSLFITELIETNLIEDFFRGYIDSLLLDTLYRKDW